MGEALITRRGGGGVELVDCSISISGSSTSVKFTFDSIPPDGYYWLEVHWEVSSWDRWSSVFPISVSNGKCSVPGNSNNPSHFVMYSQFYSGGNKYYTPSIRDAWFTTSSSTYFNLKSSYSIGGSSTEGFPRVVYAKMYPWDVFVGTLS